MTDIRTWPFRPGLCVNCDSADVSAARPLYCSESCSQTADLVRYVRARRRDGTESRADIREAIQMRTAHVLAGGYPQAARRVRTEVRALVFERAGGRCESCGVELDFENLNGPTGATIQHVNGSSGELANLKAYCRRCNNMDAQSRFVPVDLGSTQAALLGELQARWDAPVPLRVCDDDQHWKATWRAFSAEAKEALALREEISEAADDRDLPGFIGWTDQGTPIQDC